MTIRCAARIRQCSGIDSFHKLAPDDALDRRCRSRRLGRSLLGADYPRNWVRYLPNTVVSTHSERLRFAPKVPLAWVVQLYRRDALLLQDEELVGKVGGRLYARCLAQSVGCAVAAPVSAQFEYLRRSTGNAMSTHSPHA